MVCEETAAMQDRDLSIPVEVYPASSEGHTVILLHQNWIISVVIMS